MLKIVSCIFLILIPSTTFSQSQSDSSSFCLLKEIITVLSHDSLKGRAVGTIEEKKSLSYIETKFKSITNKKLKIQSFNFQLDSTTINSENGYFYINKHKKQTILISAHYDHIGLGGKLSLSARKDQIHNGADDNASGVALLLSLVNDLIHSKDSKYNYLIVFYSAHEVGLFGSENFYHFLIESKKKIKPICLAINFDMVGRMDPELKKYKCFASNDSLISTNSSFYSDFGFNLNITNDTNKLSNLDTHKFLENNINCLNFTSGIHIDYHSVNDDEKYINYEGLLLFRKYILTYISSL
jgi:Zn-dependent M28 family amino/carboxypeptidase